MQGRLIGLAGLSAVATGAFIRSCSEAGRDLASAVCGAHAQGVLNGDHVHCAGCVVIAAGLVMLAASLAAMLIGDVALAKAGAIRR